MAPTGSARLGCGAGRRGSGSARRARPFGASARTRRPCREGFGELFGRWNDRCRRPGAVPLDRSAARDWLERRLPEILACGRERAGGRRRSSVTSTCGATTSAFATGRAVLVDWNWLSHANADLDLAAWLPSLTVEGGPPPWEVLPGSGALAAFIAGVWAAVVGLPPPETARPSGRCSARSSPSRSTGSTESFETGRRLAEAVGERLELVRVQADRARLDRRLDLARERERLRCLIRSSTVLSDAITDDCPRAAGCRRWSACPCRRCTGRRGRPPRP